MYLVLQPLKDIINDVWFLNNRWLWDWRWIKKIKKYEQRRIQNDTSQNLVWETWDKFDDIKEERGGYNSKDRQYNEQTKKDKQWSIKHEA